MSIKLFDIDTNSDDQYMDKEDWSGVDQDWSPNFSNIVNKLFKDKSKKDDPIKALYDTAIKISNQEDNGENSGDWEMTEKIDKNFSRLIDEVKNNEQLQNEIGNPNLDNYSDEGFKIFDNLFGKSGGQKYRDERIRPESSGPDYLDWATDISNGINAVNYNIAKPIATGLTAAVQGIDNGVKDIFKYDIPFINEKTRFKPDDLKVIPSITGDLLSVPLGAVALGATAGPEAAPIGAIAAPAIKNILESKSDYDKVFTGIDPITGQKYSDDEKSQIGAEALINTLAGGLTGLAGGTFAKPIGKAISKITPKIIKKGIGKIEGVIDKIPSNKISNIIGNNMKDYGLPVGLQAISGNPAPYLPEFGITNFLNKSLKNIGRKKINPEIYKTTGLTSLLGSSKVLSNQVMNDNEDQAIYNNPDYVDSYNPYEPGNIDWLTIRKWNWL